MSVIRWQPLRDAMSLREAMDNLFEESFVRPSRTPRAGGTAELPVNVWEDQDVYHLTARVPGLEPDDLDISLLGSELTIRGRFGSDAEREEAKGWSWHVNELWFGNFERKVYFPTEVRTDQVEAKFHNGVLHLTVPKAEAAKPKSIKVQVGK